MSPGAAYGPSPMSRVIANISVSLDGFVAGPNQTIDVVASPAATHVKYRVVR